MVKILKIVNVHYSMAFIEELQKYFGQHSAGYVNKFYLPKYDVIATHKFINRCTCISEHAAGLAVRERFKQ